jgi:hypothetical protein
MKKTTHKFENACVWYNTIIEIDEDTHRFSKLILSLDLEPLLVVLSQFNADEGDC